MDKVPYNKFSDFLKRRYGKKIYKIPVNIPCGCPNRDGSKGTGGCIFCGEEGAGFETMDSFIPVGEQIRRNMEYMGTRYKAGGYIAYFQNYSNTYLDFNDFKRYMEEACAFDISALYISTRPDCVFEHHAQFLEDLSARHCIDVVIEMGLQSTSDKTLGFLNRQHTTGDFINAVNMLKKHGLGTCAHMITDIPTEDSGDVTRNARLLSSWGVDQVKCHSLYILKDTVLGDMYENGEFSPIECSEFIDRTIIFLRNLEPGIVVQRLMGRAPEDRSLFCNYGRSWRAVVDEITDKMVTNNWKQGDLY